MKSLISHFKKFAEYVAAFMMAAMFLTFIVQIAVRYSAKLSWIADAVPLLDPANFGWTLEFCLLLWVLLIFWGCAFVVRHDDHVRFDIVFSMVPRHVRRWLVVIFSTIICVGLLISIEPTWSKFAILRLKKTATLSGLFGDWLRMRHIYAIYVLFLAVVALRFAWLSVRAVKNNPQEDWYSLDERPGK
jgi:C4-dicarboxylate transporter DctQ subunit